MLAVLALAVIGVLVASAHLAGRSAQLAGERRFLRAEALAAAEYGVERVAANAPIPAWRAMLPGSTDSAGPWTVGRASASVRVARLGDSANAIVQLVGVGAVGTIPGRSARRSSSLTLAISGATFAPPGALTTTAPVTLGAGSLVEGADLPPAGWNCPVPAPTLAGIVTPDASTVSTSACGSGCTGGAPPIAQSLVASDTLTYFAYGELTFVDLAATALRVPGTVTPAPSLDPSGACLTGDPTNWGDPDRTAPPGACESHFPVLYAPGDLHLAGGVGQGVLLVEGNLTVSGGARFVGLVVARGSVGAIGSGGRIEGAVLAASLGGATNDFSGPLSIVQSRCALRAAEQASERIRPVPFIAWGEVY